MGIKEETVTYVCDGCNTEEVVQGAGSKSGFRPSLGMPVGWESVPTKNHEYLVVCYDCFQKQDSVSTLKVLSFIDDCGHSVVIDVTDPRNRVKVYRDILKEAYFHDKEGQKALLAESEEALSHKDTTTVRLLTIAGKLIDAVNDADLDEICSGRDGLSPFTPSTSWK